MNENINNRAMNVAELEKSLTKWAGSLGYDLSPTFIKALAIFVFNLPR